VSAAADDRDDRTPRDVFGADRVEVGECLGDAHSPVRVAEATQTTAEFGLRIRSRVGDPATSATVSMNRQPGSLAIRSIAVSIVRGSLSTPRLGDGPASVGSPSTCQQPRHDRRRDRPRHRRQVGGQYSPG